MRNPWYNQINKCKHRMLSSSDIQLFRAYTNGNQQKLVQEYHSQGFHKDDYREYTLVCTFLYFSACRQTDVWGSSSIHPSSVWGQEQKHDKRDLLPSNLCNRYQQYPVRVRRCHRRDHCQQPARLWALLTAAAARAHPIFFMSPMRSFLKCLYSSVYYTLEAVDIDINDNNSISKNNIIINNSNSYNNKLL